MVELCSDVFRTVLFCFGFSFTLVGFVLFWFFFVSFCVVVVFFLNSLN